MESVKTGFRVEGVGKVYGKIDMRYTSHGSKVITFSLGAIRLDKRNSTETEKKYSYTFLNCRASGEIAEYLQKENINSTAGSRTKLEITGFVSDRTFLSDGVKRRKQMIVLLSAMVLHDVPDQAPENKAEATSLPF